MRTIKFRAWDKVTNTMFKSQNGFQDGQFMLYSINLDSNGANYCSVGVEDEDGSDRTSSRLTENFTLMQFTGLLDKNGKEIYEGDVWKDIQGNIEAIVISPNGIFPQSARSVYGEVIGNIYENSELLT